jgi:hypothetical protein
MQFDISEKRTEIKVTPVRICGTCLYYPLNDTARVILDVMKRKSFSKAQIFKLGSIFTITSVFDVEVDK